MRILISAFAVGAIIQAFTIPPEFVKMVMGVIA